MEKGKNKSYTAKKNKENTAKETDNKENLNEVKEKDPKIKYLTEVLKRK